MVGEKIVMQLSHVDLKDMAAQSRQIQVLVLNFKKLEELYNKLKNIEGEEFIALDKELNASLVNAKRFMDDAKKAREDEFDDILKKIRKVSKKINDDD